MCKREFGFRAEIGLDREIEEIRDVGKEDEGDLNVEMFVEKMKVT